MKRRSARFSDDTHYPRSTYYLRIAEMILCIVCLGLAFIYWTSHTVFLGALVISFATAFAFFIMTVADFCASFKHRQYTAPVWVGLAFFAAFMFFLSFGYLLQLAIFKHLLIGVIFGITGAVFLLDGILILVKLMCSNSSTRVHPEHEEKEAVDEKNREEELEIIDELPVEKRYQSLAQRAKSSPSKTSSKQFPVTSYGGTFPVGEGDAAPLPTPNELTGLEPLSSQSLTKTKRNTRDKSTDSPLIQIENVERRSADVPKHLYPVVEETRVSESKETQVYVYPAQSDPEISKSRTSTNHSTISFKEPIYEEHLVREKIERIERNRIEEEPPLQQREIDRTVSVSSYQTDGALQSAPTSVFAPRDNEPEITPDDSQSCRCCATRTVRQMSSNDPRYQITPFVTHHYNQTPCVCGYTHFQASTIIKGAVRQFPQDTVEQQQKMIKEQLQQMKADTMIYGCTCNDKATGDGTVGYVSVVSDPTNVENPENNPDLHPENPDFPKNNRVSEVVNNQSKSTSPPNEPHNDSHTQMIYQSERERAPSVNLDEERTHRRVTISSMEVPAETIEIRNSSEYTRWSNSMEGNRPTKSLLKNKHESFSMSTSTGPSNRSTEAISASSTELVANSSPDSPDRISSSYYENYRQFSEPSKDGSKETLLNARIEDLASRSDEEYYHKKDVFELSEVQNREDNFTCSRSENCHCCPYAKKKPVRPERTQNKENNLVMMASNESSILSTDGNTDSEPAQLPLENNMKNILIQRLSSAITKELRIRTGPTGKFGNARGTFEVIEKNMTSKILPRILYPVEERQMRSSLRFTGERMSRIPSKIEGTKRDVKTIGKKPCVCKCECHPKKRNNSSSMASAACVYNAGPLNEKPYHPKDDFKMPENAFRTLSITDRKLSGGLESEQNVGRNSTLEKSTVTDVGIRRISEHTQQQSLAQPRRRSNQIECVQGCPGYQAGNNRISREANLRKSFDLEDGMSNSKRSLKRSYPDEGV